MMYLLLASMEVIVWRMEMRAAVVEPHGRNANWSDMFVSSLQEERGVDILTNNYPLKDSA